MTQRRKTERRSPMPAFLTAHVPAAECSSCGRQSWDPEVKIGQSCGLPQEGGVICPGRFRVFGRTAPRGDQF